MKIPDAAFDQMLIQKDDTAFLATMLASSFSMRAGTDPWSFSGQSQQVKEVIHRLLRLYSISERQPVTEQFINLQAILEEKISPFRHVSCK